MEVFKSPGPDRTAVYPVQAFRMIEQFRRWIGHEVLVKKARDYRTVLKTKQGVATAMLREKNLLIEALDLYESATFGRRRTPKRLPDNLEDLANIAAQYAVIGPTLHGAVDAHHRHSIIGSSYRSTLLEWKTANALARTNSGLSIAWLPPNKSGPEFIARVDGQDFEVECKYVSHMITELFGDSEAVALADVIISLLRRRGLRGNVHVEVDAELAELSNDHRLAVASEALANVASGDSLVDVAGRFRVEMNLRDADNAAVSASEWHQEMARRKGSDERAYGHAVARPPHAIDPITLYMTGPRRGPEELLNHIWEVKFKKAAEQCSGARGAVLSFEWEGVQEASVFTESEGIQALLERAFAEYSHIAAIVMRCDNAPSRLGGIVDYAAQAYLAKSSVTKFPKVAELLRFDR